MKKSVSIIGTCVTRELFNDPRLKDAFSVDVYGFKVCPFSLFDNSLNLPSEMIFKSPIAESQAVNFDYNVNKTLVSKIEEKHSDYLFIDLFSIANDPIFEVEYEGSKTVMQLDWFSLVFEKLNKYLSGFGSSMDCTRLNVSSLDSQIREGLSKLAEWGSSRFENIVVVWPRYSKRFFNESAVMKSYSPKIAEMYEQRQTIIDCYTEYLSSLLPSAKVLKWSSEYISRMVFTDFIKLNKGEVVEPNPVHLLTANYDDIVSSLLELLQLDYREFYDKPLDYASFKMESLKNEYERLRNFRDSSYNGVLCHINAYTNYLKTLRNHLIVISSKGDISKKLRFYRNKNVLGYDKKSLSWNAVNENYIAVIDTKNGFVYEEHSPDAVSYVYDIPDSLKYVKVLSDAIKSEKPTSSIVFYGKECSKNRRGINIVVVDLISGQVVDSASCDITNDPFMLVDSDYLSVFKD